MHDPAPLPVKSSELQALVQHSPYRTILDMEHGLLDDHDYFRESSCLASCLLRYKSINAQKNTPTLPDRARRSRTASAGASLTLSRAPRRHG